MEIRDIIKNKCGVCGQRFGRGAQIRTLNGLRYHFWTPATTGNKNAPKSCYQKALDIACNVRARKVKAIPPPDLLLNRHFLTDLRGETIKCPLCGDHRTVRIVNYPPYLRMGRPMYKCCSCDAKFKVR